MNSETDFVARNVSLVSSQRMLASDVAAAKPVLVKI
jgi:translation elongation factor EF-Ts